jgi:DNA polymerase III alpha subunit
VAIDLTQPIPQLRCKTEFSFRDGRNIQTFAPVRRMAEALADLGCPAAGIVDGGTWGHVKWLKALEKHAIAPLFGREFTVAQEDGKKPKAWALGGDMAAFYRMSTAACREGADIRQLFRETAGLIRFSGTALTDPDEFDYVDLNPSSPLSQRNAIRLAQHTGKPLVLTSDNAYAAPKDYAAFMAISGGRSKVTPQHLLSLAEMRSQFRQLDDEQFERAVANTWEAAGRAQRTLAKAPLINFPGDLRAQALAGKEYRVSRGHIVSWTDEYEARMDRELEAIASKGFDSYFFVVADMIAWAKQRMLVGPGRGSSAGSLVCYLLGITEVDPLPFKLLFERFIDLTRADLPDIDVDFSDRKRELVFDYLSEKYGRDCVARIGNINTMKPRTVMGKIGEVFAIPSSDVFGLLNVLIEYSSGDSRYGKSLEDTLTLTDPGRTFVKKYPEASLMGEIENHATHTGVHAAGVIVSNVPVNQYCTVGAEGVAQLDKPDSEHLNLLKIDALGLSTLGVIEDAGVVTGDELYALKLDDPKVFQVFNDKKFAGVFQFEGSSQRSITAQIEIRSFQEIDHVTALARPGPLGGGATGKYIERHAGRAEVEASHPRIAHMLEDTYGVVLYQEQVMQIVREIGKFSWDQTTAIRKAMSGRKGKEYFDKQGESFIAGAAQDGIDGEMAKVIWEELCSFGAWGMNKSHTCAYAVIAYWCAWMKVYHPVAYAAACLRHADDEDKVLALLRDITAEGVDYVAFDADKSDVDWGVADGRLVGGFRNLVGFGPANAVAAVEARRTGTMDEKLRAKIAKAHVKFQELHPLYAEFRTIYDDPTTVGAREGSRVCTAETLPERGDCLYIGRINKKEMRDENETVRVARRGGARKDGPTLFADFFLKDDTGVPVIVRVPPVERYAKWGAREKQCAGFEPLGRNALERLQEGDVVLVRGNRIPNFPMIQVLRMKCLNREVDLS